MTWQLAYTNHHKVTFFLTTTRSQTQRPDRQRHRRLRAEPAELGDGRANSQATSVLML